MIKPPIAKSRRRRRVQNTIEELVRDKRNDPEIFPENRHAFYTSMSDPEYTTWIMLDKELTKWEKKSTSYWFTHSAMTKVTLDPSFIVSQINKNI